jgi:hypothetical protein
MRSPAGGGEQKLDGQFNVACFEPLGALRLGRIEYEHQRELAARRSEST